jgi:hypothetical protein
VGRWRVGAGKMADMSTCMGVRPYGCLDLAVTISCTVFVFGALPARTLTLRDTCSHHIEHLSIYAGFVRLLDGVHPARSPYSLLGGAARAKTRPTERSEQPHATMISERLSLCTDNSSQGSQRLSSFVVMWRTGCLAMRTTSPSCGGAITHTLKYTACMTEIAWMHFLSSRRCVEEADLV